VQDQPWRCGLIRCLRVRGVHCVTEFPKSRRLGPIPNTPVLHSTGSPTGNQRNRRPFHCHCFSHERALVRQKICKRPRCCGIDGIKGAVAAPNPVGAAGNAQRRRMRGVCVASKGNEHAARACDMVL
jgi:hypothetical protein